MSDIPPTRSMLDLMTSPGSPTSQDCEALFQVCETGKVKQLDVTDSLQTEKATPNSIRPATLPNNTGKPCNPSDSLQTTPKTTIAKNDLKLNTPSIGLDWQDNHTPHAASHDICNICEAYIYKSDREAHFLKCSIKRDYPQLKSPSPPPKPLPSLSVSDIPGFSASLPWNKHTEPIAPGTTTEMNTDALLTKPIYLDWRNTQQFYCEYCESCMDTLEMFESHKTGRKHKYRVSLGLRFDPPHKPRTPSASFNLGTDFTGTEYRDIVQLANRLEIDPTLLLNAVVKIRKPRHVDYEISFSVAPGEEFWTRLNAFGENLTSSFNSISVTHQLSESTLKTMDRIASIAESVTGKDNVKDQSGAMISFVALLYVLFDILARKDISYGKKITLVLAQLAQHCSTAFLGFVKKLLALPQMLGFASATSRPGPDLLESRASSWEHMTPTTSYDELGKVEYEAADTEVPRSFIAQICEGLGHMLKLPGHLFSNFVDGDWKSISQILFMISRGIDSVQRIVTLVLTVVKNFCLWVKDKLVVNPILQNNQRMSQLFVTLAAYSVLFGPTSISASRDVAQLVERTRVEWIVARKAIRDLPQTVPEVQQLERQAASMTLEFKELFNAAQHAMNEYNVRSKPLFVLFCGRPNVGKSTTLAHEYTAHVLKAFGLNHDSRRTFVPPKTFDFFDGYDPVKHQAILLDDPLAVKDPERFRGYCDFVHAVAGAEIATLRTTGVTWDRHKHASPWVVIQTCNRTLPFTPNEILTEPEALFRRMDFIFEVLPATTHCLNPSENNRVRWKLESRPDDTASRVYKVFEHAENGSKKYISLDSLFPSHRDEFIPYKDATHGDVYTWKQVVQAGILATQRHREDYSNRLQQAEDQPEQALALLKTMPLIAQEVADLEKKLSGKAAEHTDLITKAEAARSYLIDVLRDPHKFQKDVDEDNHLLVLVNQALKQALTPDKTSYCGKLRYSILEFLLKLSGKIPRNDTAAPVTDEMYRIHKDKQFKFFDRVPKKLGLSQQVWDALSKDQKIQILEHEIVRPPGIAQAIWDKLSPEAKIISNIGPEGFYTDEPSTSKANLLDNVKYEAWSWTDFQTAAEREWLGFKAKTAWFLQDLKDDPWSYLQRMTILLTFTNQFLSLFITGSGVAVVAILGYQMWKGGIDDYDERVRSAVSHRPRPRDMSDSEWDEIVERETDNILAQYRTLDEYHKYEKKGKRPKAKTKHNRQAGRDRKMRYEFGFDQHLDDQLKLLSKNIGLIHFKDEESRKSSQIFAVDNKHVIFSYHMYSVFMDPTTKKIRNPNVEAGYQFGNNLYRLDLQSNHVFVRSQDWVMYEVPQLPFVRQIHNYFVNEDYVDEFEPVQVGRFGCRLDDPLSTHLASGTFRYKIFGEDISDDHNLAAGFTYQASSGGGNSGGMILELEKGPRILGLHIGSCKGMPPCALGAFITVENIKGALERLSKMQPYAAAGSLPSAIKLSQYEICDFQSGILSIDEEITGPKIALPTDFDKLEVVATVPPDQGVHVPTNTVFVESPLAGLYPNTLHPAPMRPIKKDGEVILPMRVALGKYDKKASKFPQDIVDAAVEDIANKIASTRTRYSEMAFLTEEQAINGIEGDPYITPLQKNTSVGYPHNLHPVYKIRQNLFKVVDGKLEPGEYLRGHLDKVDECILNGEPYKFCWMDIGKDELIDTQKAKNGKLRIINCAPIEWTIRFRQFFLPLAAHIMSQHLLGETTVGINVHSFGWSILYHRLLRKGRKIIAGDYSAYDKNMEQQMLQAALKILILVRKRMSKQLDDYWKRGATILYQNLLVHYHIVGRVIYRLTHGHCSGDPMTAIINSLVEQVIKRVCFVILTQLPVHLFNEMVEKLTYGDDHADAPDESIHEQFNQITIANLLAEYGITYTDPIYKEFPTSEFTDIEELVFLCRKFRHDPNSGWTFAPRELDDMLSSIQWMRKSENPQEMLKQQLTAFCLDLWHHGEDKYNLYLSEILDHLGEVGWPIPVLPTFKSIDLHFRQNQQFRNIYYDSDACHDEEHKSLRPVRYETRGFYDRQDSSGPDFLTTLQSINQGVQSILSAMNGSGNNFTRPVYLTNQAGNPVQVNGVDNVFTLSCDITSINQGSVPITTSVPTRATLVDSANLALSTTSGVLDTNVKNTPTVNAQLPTIPLPIDINKVSMTDSLNVNVTGGSVGISNSTPIDVDISNTPAVIIQDNVSVNINQVNGQGLSDGKLLPIRAYAVNSSGTQLPIDNVDNNGSATFSVSNGELLQVRIAGENASGDRKYADSYSSDGQKMFINTSATVASVPDGLKTVPCFNDNGNLMPLGFKGTTGDYMINARQWVTCDNNTENKVQGIYNSDFDSAMVTTLPCATQNGSYNYRVNSIAHQLNARTDNFDDSAKSAHVKSDPQTVQDQMLQDLSNVSRMKPKKGFFRKEIGNTPPQLRVIYETGETPATTAAEIDPPVEQEEMTQFHEAPVVREDVAPMPSNISNPFKDTDTVNFFNRPIVVQTVDIDSTKKPGDFILYFDPLGCHLSNPVIWAKVRGFRWLRCKLVVEVRINGTSFHYGMISCSYIPPSRVEPDTMNEYNYYANMSNTIFLELKQEENGSLTIPFLWPEYAIDLDAYKHDFTRPTLGKVAIMMLTPLGQGQTTKTISMTVMTRMIDVELSGETYANLVIPNKADMIQTRTSAYVRSTPIVAQITRDWGIFAPGGPYTTGAIELLEDPDVRQRRHRVNYETAENISDFFYRLNLDRVSRDEYRTDVTNTLRYLAELERIKTLSYEVKPTPEATQRSKTGMVTQIAQGVSKVAGVASAIPLFGAPAAAVSTVAGAIGSISNIFGWAKPVDQKANRKVQVSWAELAHGSGIEGARLLALEPSNHVDLRWELMCGKEQDMEILEICMSPSLLKSFTIDSTMNPGDVVFEWDVHPWNMCWDAVLNQPQGRAIYYGTPSYLTHASMAARFWRGSIRLHFKAVASSYHGGRFRLEFIPGQYLGADKNIDPTDMDVQDAGAHVHSTVFSIGDSVGAEPSVFTIPYDRDVMWLNTDLNEYANNFYMHATPPAKAGDPNVDNGLVNWITKLLNGRVRMTVVNRLTHAQDEVPPIWFLVWISAGPDFQLARPVVDSMNASQCNIHDVYPQDPLGGLIKDPEEPELEIVERPNTSNNTKLARLEVFTWTDLKKGGKSFTEQSTQLNIVKPETQMGESFVHVKQQISRNHMIQRCKVPQSANGQTFMGSYVSVFNLSPFMVNHAMSDAQAFLRGTDNKAYLFYDQNSNLRGNPLAFWQKIFAVHAGSFVVRVLNVYEPLRPANENIEVTINNMNVRPYPVATIDKTIGDDSVAADTLYDGNSLTSRLGAGMMYKPINSTQIVAEATIPFYDRRFFLNTPLSDSTGQKPRWYLNNQQQEPIPQALVQAVIDPNTNFQICMAAADDYHLAFLVPPSMTQLIIYAGFVAASFT